MGLPVGKWQFLPDFRSRSILATILNEKHLESVSCNACHSDIYWSCQGCHEGEPEVVTNVVRLGLGNDGKITTLTHTPISATMFGEPVLDMNQLNTKSSWIEVNPHTIKSIQPTEEFCAKCHTADHEG